MKKTLLILLVTLGFYSWGLGQSPFTQGNIVVLRVGDGSAALTNASTASFIDEYTTSGTFVQSIAIPTTGLNKLTNAGTSGTEGLINLSPDGQYLTLAGYDIAPGTASIAATTSAVANRKLLRVDNAVNYVPVLSATAFSAGNPRSGVTTGTDYWASGSNQGIHYFGEGTPALVSSTVTNTRAISVQNGQLYFSTGSGTCGIYAVGTGLPIIAGQTSVNLINTGTSTTSSPYAFAFNSTSDICYISDDRTSAPVGGVQKWTKSGSIWSLSYTLSVGAAIGARGLTVDWSGANPIIYATTTGSKLVKFTDTGAGSTFTDLATSATNTAFRGIAFAPSELVIIAPTIQAYNITFSNILQTQMDVSWTIGDGAKRVVVLNTSNSFTTPADGTDPTADPVYGGSGEQVVYNNSGNSVPTVSGLTAGTTYWFKVFEYNGAGTATLYCTASGANNPKSQATAAGASAPLIIEPTATNITANSAILGGNITADGGSPITERGTVWSTTSPVTISDNKLAEGGTATGIFTHVRTSLPANTLIYYAAYATNSIGTTLTDESSFTTFLAEPTNHAASFSAISPIYNSITLAWSDNDGPQPATGFLILANTTGTFTDPADGTPVTNDFTLYDGSGAVNVNHGIQNFIWYALNSSTTYYFAIYPYTNSGSNIDYKITPTAPTATITTQVYLAPIAAWTFDATPAAPNTPTSVAANIGFQSGTAMLYADGTNGSSAWLQATELSAFSGTTINDPREGSAAVSGVSYCPLGGTSNSANGKSMVLKFSMEDYQNPVLTFATRGTATGFTTQQWAWSIDNVTYTDFGPNTANTGTSFVFRTLDMSSIDALDQAVDVYLRVTFSGATSASGNNRLENIVLRESTAITLNLKVFLEGPYDAATNLMKTDLLTSNLLPLSQPFNPALPYYGNNTPKWLYNGTQSVTSFPAGTVDYILIELRDAASPAAATSATRIAQIPALLKSDGSIVSLDGSLPSFTNSISNFLHIVIWSRNHVGIMSSGNITPGGTVVWDFTTGSSQVYNGAAGYKEIETGVWGMAAGDINADGNVDATDKSPLGWKVDVGKKGYLGADLNMNTQVSNKDKNDFLYPNFGKSTQVPN